LILSTIYGLYFPEPEYSSRLLSETTCVVSCGFALLITESAGLLGEEVPMCMPPTFLWHSGAVACNGTLGVLDKNRLERFP